MKNPVWGDKPSQGGEREAGCLPPVRAIPDKTEFEVYRVTAVESRIKVLRPAPSGEVTRQGKVG